MQSTGKCLKSKGFTTQCLAFLKKHRNKINTEQGSVIRIPNLPSKFNFCSDVSLIYLMFKIKGNPTI